MARTGWQMCQDLGMESRGQRPCLDRRLSRGHRRVGWGQAGDPSQRPGGTCSLAAEQLPTPPPGRPQGPHRGWGAQAARASLAGGLQSSVCYTRNPLSSRNFWNPSQNDSPYHTIANRSVSE